MYDFAYHRPKSLADATAALKGKPEARAMSGGMTLIPTLKQRLAKPSDVVDLNGIKELAGIKVEGSGVTIGGMTRHADVASSAEVKGAIPALAYLAGHIGDPQVRNRGTIGGSVANNDPAADYPAAVVGLNATVTTTSRKIAADDFFKGLFATALADGEIITAVIFPVPAKAGYAKFPHPASRFALTGVFVAKTKSGDVRVAATGASSTGVMRVPTIEAALKANWAAAALDNVKIPDSGLLADIHGSADYRANLVRVMAQRAATAAG
jgi:aerobic carbon-monoxide dehydrogenase medium subunit